MVLNVVGKQLPYRVASGGDAIVLKFVAYICTFARPHEAETLSTEYQKSICRLT